MPIIASHPRIGVTRVAIAGRSAAASAADLRDSFRRGRQDARRVAPMSPFRGGALLGSPRIDRSSASAVQLGRCVRGSRCGGYGGRSIAYRALLPACTPRPGILRLASSPPRRSRSLAHTGPESDPPAPEASARGLRACSSLRRPARAASPHRPEVLPTDRARSPQAGGWSARSITAAAWRQRRSGTGTGAHQHCALRAEGRRRLPGCPQGDALARRCPRLRRKRKTRRDGRVPCFVHKVPWNQGSEWWAVQGSNL